MPLAITQQPTDQTIYFGDSGQFSVAVEGGTEPYAYQWYETTAGLLVGETAGVLSIPNNDQTLDGNSYYCEVTDASPTTLTSDTATLTILPAITSEVVDVRVKATDGTWVSIMGPQGEPGEDGTDIIDDDRTRDYLTWSSEKIQSELDAHIAAHVGEGNPHGKVNWRGGWEAKAYNAHDEVLDNGWLMIANKATNERAAVLPIGDPEYAFDGTLVAQSVTAKQVIFGIRITPADNGYLTGYRVNTVVGNEYAIYVVEAPTGTPVVSPVSTFVGAIDGWSGFNVSPAIVRQGDTFDLVAVVSEPDPTPTTWTADWDYQKPQNVTAPLTGQATHSGKTTDIISIHYTDNGAVDRKAALQALTVGDLIELGDVSWAIQSITDRTTYIDFVVAPALQYSATGVQTFTFQTVTATPIMYHQDTDYFLGSANARGLFGADVDYGAISPDDNAYGIDIEYQLAAIPEDWDVKAYTSSANGGGSGGYSGVDSIRGSLVGWKDNFANLTAAASGAGTPSLQPFGPSGNIKQRRFGVGDSVYVVWHIDHDVKPDSTCYMHVHWASDGTNTGLVAWEVNYTIAKGHNQESFGSDATITVEEAGHGTAWRHMITEDTVGMIIPEVDSLVIAEVKRVSPSAGSNNDDIFGLFVDLHYESNRDHTPSRSPDFYV